MIRRVAIIGAGFSGALLAINLLRHDGPSAVLVERAGRAGKGLAYGAAHPSHLLNVRAGNMSAFPTTPAISSAGSRRAASRTPPARSYGERSMANIWPSFCPRRSGAATAG